MIKKFNVEKTRQLKKINSILSLFYRKPKTNECKDLIDAKNILVIDFALMGDMVMDIPFFRTIRRNCPNAKITMVCMQWAEVILGDQGLIDEFIVFNGKDYLASPKSIAKHYGDVRKALKQINTKSYDIGIEPKGDLRHTLFMRYTNCKRTISYNYTGGEFLVNESYAPKPETKHLIDEKLDLLEMSGFVIDDTDRLPELSLSDNWRRFAEDFKEKEDLRNRFIIGIHPGASNVNKQYRYYPDLVKKIDGLIDRNAVYCVFEGPGEEKIVDAVVEKLTSIGRDYRRIKRKVKEYISIVSICDVMICNDSAAGHLAAAYGIPTVVIFGPVKAETALPRGRNAIEFVSHEFDCKPCTLPVCPLGTEECIKSVGIEEVAERFKRIMDWHN